jgi:hypothetical protein
MVGDVKKALAQMGLSGNFRGIKTNLGPAMPLVRVYGNTYLNPLFVGKVELTVTFKEKTADRYQSRTNVTKVYDSTGKNILAELETTISLSPDNPDKDATARDNFNHAEVVRAIIEMSDATDFLLGKH